MSFHAAFADGTELPHASDSIQVLNQDNLKYGYRIYSRFSPFGRRIQVLDFFINKVKVYCSIYFPQQVISWNQIFQTYNADIFLLVSILLLIHRITPES